MNEKTIEQEIAETIKFLCRTIQFVEIPTTEMSELVKATAELIQSTKDRGVF